MARIGVAVLKDARAVGDGVEDFALHQERADRRIAAAESLSKRHKVGTHAFLLAGMQRARAPHAAHHFIENEQDAVAVADITHAREISGHRGDGTQRGANDRLGNKRDYATAAKLFYLGLELLRQALAISTRGLVDSPPAIFVARRDVMRLDQQRAEGLALLKPSANREGAERDPMIALASSDEVSPLRLAAFDEILSRELKRGLDCLRSAAKEKDMADAARGMGDQIISQFLSHPRREKACMCIGQPVELRMHRRQHIPM